MAPPARTTVLISELTVASAQRAYLPYVWGLLRSHVEHEHPDLRDALEWLPPLFGGKPPANALRDAGADRIDVLGLSCYTWNWDPQRELARLCREQNPGCLIIAGGPQPDATLDDFFDRHPYLDAVVVNDGEVPFGEILRRACAGKRDISGIPGVVIRGEDGTPSMAAPPVRPTGFAHSPYLEYSRTYEEIARSHPGTSAVLETNRGCPYKCSFCDWGSNTNAKVRRFNLDRVKAEMEWAFRQPLLMLFLADANFGILPRDLEIAEHLAALPRPPDGPKFFYYSPAKNNPDRTTAIARLFMSAGLTTKHHVALQHTDPGVLAATDRANISMEKQRQVVNELTRDGVALATQLILGIPGDTVGKWEQVFADLMEWGLHDSWMVSEYALLPNAPAADPAFREQWRYETIRRPAAAHGRSRPKGSREGTCDVDLIVSSKTFTREDWVRMRTFTAIVTGLHSTGYTRRLAQYLRFDHGVPYRALYDLLINDLIRRRFRAGSWWTTIEDSLYRFLTDPLASDALDSDEIPELELELRHDDWLMLQVGLHRDELFEALRDCLIPTYPHATGLSELLEYQRQLIITCDYDPAEGRRFACDLEWTDYFQAIDTDPQHTPELAAAAPGTVYLIDDRATGLYRQHRVGWADVADPGARQLAWARAIVAMDRASASQCFDLPRRVPAGDLVQLGGA